MEEMESFLQSLKLSLDQLIEKNDTVFIVGHNDTDFDSLGSCLGLALICKRFKKPVYIVMDDDESKMYPELKTLVDEVRNRIPVIKAKEVDGHITDNSLLLVTDTNKKHLISVGKSSSDFSDVLVLDHHKKDANTIETPNMYVNGSLSSASEAVANVIKLYGMKLSPEVANFILSGILLDTKDKGYGPFTTDAMGTLLRFGADIQVAKNLFTEEFQHDRELQRIVDRTDFINYEYAVAADTSESGKIYGRKDIAQIADYILKYKVNASFALALVSEDTVGISARSRGCIDVGSIMEKFGGGGSETSAYAQVTGIPIYNVKELLKLALIPGFFSRKERVDQWGRQLLPHDEQSGDGDIQRVMKPMSTTKKSI